MNTHNNSRFATFIAIAEMLLLFVSSMMGNKIADSLNISSTLIIITTAICLVTLSVISYLKTHDSAAIQVKPLRFGVNITRFLPRTMVGMFPFGVIIGLLAGSTLPFSISGFAGIWTQIGTSYLGMYAYEFWGIAIAIIICLIFAILIDGPLAGAFIFGYGLSFATAILIIRPSENDYLMTYLAYGAGFIILALLFTITEPILAFIRKTITKPRV